MNDKIKFVTKLGNYFWWKVHFSENKFLFQCDNGIIWIHSYDNYV